MLSHVHTCYVTGLEAYTGKKGHRVESGLGENTFVLVYTIQVR